MKELIASLAVFRELYDQRKDIYDVLMHFISVLIAEKGLKCFTTVLLTQQLKDEFGFRLPEAVIKTSLKRLSYLKKSNLGEYIVDSSKFETIKNFTSLYEQSNSVYHEMFGRLIDYIKKITKKELSDSEKEIVQKELFSYLLDEGEIMQYTKYIAAYLITETEPNIRSILKDIREGLILYSGITYSDISRLGSWNTEIAVYFDTEILFQMAGFDGELYKMFFDDFFAYVKDINTKSQKKLIKLRSFISTRKEIETFFYKACEIVAGKDILSPERTAMSTIVQNCKLESDVIIKKSDFFTLLTTNGIELEEDELDITKKV
ncbi:MAG: hypothetical protein FWC36_02640 [Spirochaetes bacterium]|nr:hypothetical protein [Spirochaetota bacterium]